MIQYQTKVKPTVLNHHIIVESIKINIHWWATVLKAPVVEHVGQRQLNVMISADWSEYLSTPTIRPPGAFTVVADRCSVIIGGFPPLILIQGLSCVATQQNRSYKSP